MSADFLKALKDEESSLVTALETFSRKLQAVRSALRELEPMYTISLSAHVTASSTLTGTLSVALEAKVAPESMSSMARNLAISTMKRTRRRLRSSEIVAMLEGNGVDVTGKNPQATIAAMLSSDSRLDNKKDEYGAGYGLAEWSLLRGTTSADLHAMGVLAPEGRIRGESDSGP